MTLLVVVKGVAVYAMVREEDTSSLRKLKKGDFDINTFGGVKRRNDQIGRVGMYKVHTLTTILMFTTSSSRFVWKNVMSS